MEVFKQTGEKLEARWRAANYDEDVFPDLAAECLKEDSIFEEVTAWDVVEWTLAQTNLPEQRDLAANFGDPPITLFNAPRFHIDVYFWLEGTTAIHQHAFCGAFQVLHGSSIHSKFSFETADRINMFVETGKLQVQSCELLLPGDTKRILPGNDLIHSLFHLDQPSATIVARTHRSPLNQPQFSYYRSGIAFSPFFEEPNTTKKVQALSAALRSDHPKAKDWIKDYLRSCDFQSAFMVLSSLRGFLGKKKIEEMFNIESEDEGFFEYVKIVGAKHANQADLLRNVFEEIFAIERIISLRNFISDPEHRFFLALILNLENLDSITELISQKYPDCDAREKILDWVSDLANTRLVGADFRNGIGVDDFGDFDVAVLEELMDGKSESEILEGFESGPSAGSVSGEQVSGSIKKIKEAAIFAPLLR